MGVHQLMTSIRERRAVSPAWQRALTVAASILILCFISFGSNSDEYYGYGFWIFASMGKHAVLVSTAAIFGVYYLLKRFGGMLLEDPFRPGETAAQVLLSLFFTVFSLLGQYFELDSDMGLGLLTERLSSKLSILLAFLGGMVLFMLVFRMIWRLSGSAGTMGDVRSPWLHRFFGRHAFRNCVLLLTLCWLPQYLIRFPGSMCFDSIHAVGIYFGEVEQTSVHPLIWVTIVGKLTELGLRIGIGWLAIPVICTVQSIVLILLAAHTVSTIRALGASVRVQALTLLFYAILPPMFMYATTVYNDVLYSAAVQLLTVELAVFLFSRDTYFARWRHPLLTMLAVLGTILRYNGLYTMLVVIAGAAVYALVMLVKKRLNVRRAVAVLCLLVVPLAAGQVIQRSLNEAYGAKSVSSRAKLAMVIQQVARCLAVHGDDIPAEDYEALHKVMTWTDEQFAQAYRARNFDGVKRGFNLDATPEEMRDFLKAWTHLLVRYPGTCFRATANLTYYLFSPLVTNVRYYFFPIYYKYVNQVNDAKGFNLYELIGEPDFGREEQRMDLFFCMDTIDPVLPVLGLLVNQAVYTILLAGICVCTLFRRDRSTLVLAMALLATLGITMIGPAVYEHPRYTYPIMYSMPVLLFAYLRANPRPGAEPTAKEDAQ